MKVKLNIIENRPDIYRNDKDINIIKIIQLLKNKGLLLNKIILSLIKTRI